MAKRPEDLTIDYKQVLRLIMPDRVAFARSSLGTELMNSLTPAQRVAMFPRYYKEGLPSAGGAPSVAGATTGYGGGPAATSGGGETAPSAPSGGEAPAPSATPVPSATGAKPTAPEKPVEKERWFQKLEKMQAEKEKSTVKLDKTNPLAKQRQNLSALNKEQKLHLYALTMAEVGRKNPQAHRSLMETIYNRNIAEGRKTLEESMRKDYYQPLKKGQGKWYNKALEDLRNDSELFAQMEARHNEVLSGSNDSNFATHNASGTVAANAIKDYDADPNTLRTVTIDGKSKETLYNKTFANEQKWLKNIQRQMREYEIEKATEVQPQVDETGKPILGPSPGRMAPEAGAVTAPLTQLPEGLEPGIIDHYKSLTPEKQQRFLQTITNVPVDTINGYYKQDQNPNAPVTAQAVIEKSNELMIKGIPDEYAVNRAFDTEENRRRESLRRGELIIPGEEPFRFASGNRSGTFPSIPHGVYEIGGRHSGRAVKEGIQIAGNYIPFDPRRGNARTGIVFHAGRTSDVNRLASHGCVVVTPKEWPRLKKAIEQFKKQNNGKAYLVVGPDGQPLQIVAEPPTNMKVASTEKVIREKIEENEEKENEGIEPTVGLPEKIKEETGLIDDTGEVTPSATPGRMTPRETAAPKQEPVSPPSPTSFNPEGDPLEGMERGRVPGNAFDALTPEEKKSLRVKFAADPSAAQKFVKGYEDKTNIPIIGPITATPDMIADSIRSSDEYKQRQAMSPEERKAAMDADLKAINDKMAAQAKVAEPTATTSVEPAKEVAPAETPKDNAPAEAKQDIVEEQKPKMATGGEVRATSEKGLGLYDNSTGMYKGTVGEGQSGERISVIPDNRTDPRDIQERTEGRMNNMMSFTPQPENYAAMSGGTHQPAPVSNYEHAQNIEQITMASATVAKNGPMDRAFKSSRFIKTDDQFGTGRFSMGTKGTHYS